MTAAVFPNTTIATRAVMGWPCSGEITLHFGVPDALHPQGHAGMDLGAWAGVPVFSPCWLSIVDVFIDAKPSSEPWIADQKWWFGNSVIGVDRAGNHHRFAHLRDAALVREGQEIEAGTLIGYVGSTGYSTGAHLHWGISRPDNRYQTFPPSGPVGVLIDPAEYVREAGRTPLPGGEFLPEAVLSGPYSLIGDRVVANMLRDHEERLRALEAK